MTRRIRQTRRLKWLSAAALLAILGNLLFLAGCPRDQQQVNEHQRVLQSEQD